MNAEIEMFCEKHVFSKQTTNNVLLIVEELLVIYRSQSKIIDVHLTLSYSEKRDSVEIVFDSYGEEGNMLDKTYPDDIGLTIIRNMTENIEYRKENGRNILSMFLKRD
jgi:polar amino acid transport system ATP-binding protein